MNSVSKATNPSRVIARSTCQYKVTAKVSPARTRSGRCSATNLSPSPNTTPAGTASAGSSASGIRRGAA